MNRLIIRLIASVCVVVVGLLICFVLLLKYEEQISKTTDRNFVRSHLFLDPLSRALPELFTKRNIRKAWYVEKANPVYGYVDVHSVFPGESFNVMLSLGLDEWTTNGHLELSRVGYYPESTNRKRVWSSSVFKVPRRKVHHTSVSVGLAWPPSATIQTEKNWPSGYYELSFVDTNKSRTENVAFVVIKNPDIRGDVLVKLGTNSYQAYNLWGGGNLYKSYSLGGQRRSQMVSFDRPIGKNTRHTFFNWEYHYILWLEELAANKGFQVHYATNFDISSDPTFTDHYKLLLSVGHDEYWTAEEFENTYRRIYELGLNTFFLGANTAYWQVRYADVNRTKESPDRGRQMICFKSPNDPIRYRVAIEEIPKHITARFREAGRNPETSLMGIGFEDYLNGKQRFPYYVTDETLPIFAGTGYQKGDSVGNIVGHEWDNMDPERDGQRLFQPGISKHPVPDKDSFQIILEGRPTAHTGKQGLAQAVLFESEAGAKVFSSGTNDWAKGLSMKGRSGEQFRRLNENMVLSFLRDR